LNLYCPTCGPKAPKKFFTKRSGFNLLQCNRCNIVFIDAIEMKIDQLFFEDSSDSNNKNKDKIEYWSFPNYYEKYEEMFNYFHEDRWNKIVKYKPNVKSLLDVGCGYGFFLDYLKGKVDIINGIELDKSVANYAKVVKKLNVDNTPIENYSCSQKFDCIVMCDVLEHVINPFKTLLKCRNLLQSKGVIYIQVPNLVGFKLPLFHSWGLPHHIWQFNYKSLKKMLEMAGYRVLYRDTGVLGVIGSYEKGGIKLLMDSIQWKVANALKIGNRLQIIALKN